MAGSAKLSQVRILATSGGNKKKFQLGQFYSYIMRKVWYYQIWIQTYLGFIVLILTYTPTFLCYNNSVLAIVSATDDGKSKVMNGLWILRPNFTLKNILISRVFKLWCMYHVYWILFFTNIQIRRLPETNVDLKIVL